MFLYFDKFQRDTDRNTSQLPLTGHIRRLYCDGPLNEIAKTEVLSRRGLSTVNTYIPR